MIKYYSLNIVSCIRYIDNTKCARKNSYEYIIFKVGDIYYINIYYFTLTI